jgi:hypothetical protein
MALTMGLSIALVLDRTRGQNATRPSRSLHGGCLPVEEPNAITNVSSRSPLWVNEIEYLKGGVVVLEDGDTIKLPRLIDGEYNYYYFTYRAPQIFLTDVDH